MAKLRVIELFAGIGAQAQALNRIGADWESVDMVEIDPYCVTAYNAIFKTDYKPQDITKVDHLKPCDMLTYSFPCTDISTAGKQLGLSKGSGTRSSLLHEVARLLDDYEARGELPKYLIMENVKNLVGKKFKADFDEWVAYLKAKGYETYWKVLNSCDYGVPQHRERVIAISILSENGENEGYEFPEPIPLTKRLKDMLEENVDEKYYITNAAVLSRLNSNYECRKNSIVQGGGICRTLTAREYKEPTCVAPSESEDEEAMTASTDGTSSGRILTMKKTNCKQVGMLSGGKWDKMHDISRRVYDTDGVAPTIHTMGGGNTEMKIVDPVIGAIRGRNPMNPSDRRAGIHTEQRLEINPSGMSNTITTVQKDNVVIMAQRPHGKNPGFIKETETAPTITSASFEQNNFIIDDTYGYEEEPRIYEDASPTIRAGRQGLKVAEPIVYDDYNGRVRADQSTIGTLTTNCGSNAERNGVKLIETAQGFRVRKLTPKECWRLMGQTDKAYELARQAMIDKHYNGKDKASSQLYKQAGNSIVVQVLEAVFSQIKGIETEW